MNSSIHYKKIIFTTRLIKRINTKYKVMALITPFFFKKYAIKKLLFLSSYHIVSDIKAAHIKYLYTIKQ